jgi:hypothetical protein
MSTYLYVECHSHNPPLRAPSESGQHLYDLPQIRSLLRWTNQQMKDQLEKYQYESYADGWDINSGYFFGNTAKFLVEHPECDIEIWDEYGVQHATFDEDD